MDEKLVLAGVEEIRAGEVDLKKLLEMTETFERDVSRAKALSVCILDGSISKLLGNSLQRWAIVHYILSSFADLGKELEKAASLALKGSEDKFGADGHQQRFAEELRSANMSKFSAPGLGTFYISSSMVATPPAKGAEKRELEAWETALAAGRNPQLSDIATQELVAKATSSIAAAELFAAKAGVKLPTYTRFYLWAKERSLTTEAYNWKGLQSAVAALDEHSVPSFITVRKREVVAFRSA